MYVGYAAAVQREIHIGRFLKRRLKVLQRAGLRDRLTLHGI